MPLKAVKPEAIEKRLKMFVYGPAGSGKTTSAIQFPRSVLIDMEKGAQNYAETIKKANSVVLETTNPDEVKSELKALITEKHPYQTVIIDPLTSLYNGLQEFWEGKFIKNAKDNKAAEMMDFGPRYWARVKSDYKGIMRMLTQGDFNVICTAHQKDVYGIGMQKLGVGPDSMKGDDFIFDFVFQLENPTGKVDGKRIARTIKQRCELGKLKFPEEFEWSYENFCKFYGREIIERESKPIVLASAQQVAEITQLLDVVKIDEDEVAKWFAKQDVDAWTEMTSEAIQKCIDFVRKKLPAPVAVVPAENGNVPKKARVAA